MKTRGVVDVFWEALFKVFIFLSLCSIFCLPPLAFFGAVGWLFNIQWHWSWVVATGVSLTVLFLWWVDWGLDRFEKKCDAQEKQLVTIFLKSPSRYNN